MYYENKSRRKNIPHWTNLHQITCNNFLLLMRVPIKSKGKLRVKPR